MNAPVLRFAPSPNGRLHLGHAYSALLNRAMADRFGGRLLLRIENIDPVRSRPEYEAAIRNDLAWLGIPFDGPVRRQSEHMAEYRAAAERLTGAGLLYPSTCTRGEIARAVEEREARSGTPWPRDPDGAPLYPGICRSPSRGRASLPGRPAAWRLDMTRALATVSGPLTVETVAPDGRVSVRPADPARWGDAVLVRKDVPTSYHLAVVLDDAIQGVTHVVRGRDLEATTDLHRLVQALLGLPPPRYHHHALISDETGAKLAKSRGSRALADLREAGVTPEAIRSAFEV